VPQGRVKRCSRTSYDFQYLDAWTCVQLGQGWPNIQPIVENRQFTFGCVAALDEPATEAWVLDLLAMHINR